MGFKVSQGVVGPWLGLFVCSILFLGAIYLHLEPRGFDFFSEETDLMGATDLNSEFPLEGGGSGKTFEGSHQTSEGRETEMPPLHGEVNSSARLESLSMEKRWRHRNKELGVRERLLRDRELVVEQQEKEIDEKIRYLDSLRDKLATMLKAGLQRNKGKVAKLAELYSTMKPQNAAQIVNRIDESLAIAVLAKMRKLRAAEILNHLEPKKAQKLSERFMSDI